MADEEQRILAKSGWSGVSLIEVADAAAAKDSDEGLRCVLPDCLCVTA
jgi:hypothetical protein